MANDRYPSEGKHFYTSESEARANAKIVKNKGLNARTSRISKADKLLNPNKNWTVLVRWPGPSREKYPMGRSKTETNKILAEIAENSYNPQTGRYMCQFCDFEGRSEYETLKHMQITHLKEASTIIYDNTM